MYISLCFGIFLEHVGLYYADPCILILPVKVKIDTTVEWWLRTE